MEASDSVPISKGISCPVYPLLDYSAKAKAKPLLVVNSYGEKKEQFGRLYGLALGTNGVIVVSDWKQNKLIFFDKHMKFKSATGASSLFQRNDCFCKPSGMASDKDGNLYLADRDHHCIKKFSILGKFVLKIGTGKAGSKNDELNQPRGVVVSNQGILYIADGLNHRIQAFHESKFLFTFGSLGSDPGRFNVPCAVALNVSEDRLFVSDNKNNRVQVFTADRGEFLHQIVHEDLRFPHGVSCNRDNHLLICSSGKCCVLVCKEDGTVVANIKGTVDGEERFSIPGEARVNNNGQIIIVSYSSVVIL